MADHCDSVMRAVVLERFLMTILGPDSTAPVLGCSPSPDELMSSISPVSRRRIVVLPRRGAPMRMTLRNHISRHSRVAKS